MKVTAKALRDFPVGEGESRRIVSEGEDIETTITQARTWAAAGKVKFDEPERQVARPKIGE